MSYLDEKYPMWFVYGAYVAAGRPKAEDAVMQYARKKYLYCLAPVKIAITDKRHRDDGFAWLKIGAQSLQLRKVKETIE